ncbi:MAG: hypothetical protein WCI05_07960, partial [Myxococcales bacterium]
PADEQALLALDRLYDRTAQWRSLVDVLRARERITSDRGARKALLTRVALTLSEKLSDVDEAILGYRAIVDDFGAEREAFAPLAALYEVADRWQDLADTLEADLSLAEAPSDRLELLTRLGVVRRGKIGDVPGAIEAYRQALILDQSHVESRAALEGLLDDEAARRDSANILRPLYEADGEDDKLLRVLDIEAEYATTEGKLALFSQAASVAEGSLNSPPRAFAYVARGLREAAAEPVLPTWLERAERLAATIGNWLELVEILREVVLDILDEQVQLDVTLTIADFARSRLGDRPLARSYYTKALELRPDERRALVALESLYEELADAPALLEVLKRRAETAESEGERKALLFKQARLSDETLKDLRAATAVYEQILEIGLEPEAITALERLYTVTERWDDLMALFERQIGLDGTEPTRKAELLHALGTVLEKRLHEVDRAFEQYAAALAIDPQHGPTVASLEELMEDRLHSARAAEMLEAVYLARLDWRRVIVTIEARLAASEEPDERRVLLRRLAQLHEEQSENYTAALETNAKLLAEDVTDETTWAELERLARVAGAEPRLAQVYASELAKTETDDAATAKLSQRTGELFEAQKDYDQALAFYKRAYAFDPQGALAPFDAVDRILRETSRPKDRIALYREALDYRTRSSERLATLHTIASLEETELGDPAAAIETYRAALDVDEADVRTLEALGRLYARLGRWRDRADLLRRRAEQVGLPEEEARFRLELGKLLETELVEAAAAIDEYQAVVDLTSGGQDGAGPEAVKALEALLHGDHKARVVEILRPIYEAMDDWRNLIEVNGERLTLAADATEKVAILHESARLWEERGNDRSRAFDAVRDAFVLDPEDGHSREELDRLAEATNRWEDLAAAYEKGGEATEGLAKRELLGALARLHDKRRDDPRRALDAWERLFALDETDLAPLEELDSLATLLSDWTTLVRVLVKKADLLLDDESRASTWRRVGEARRDMLEDNLGAIDAYERALELEPSSAFTLDSLIELHEGRNDAARLVDLYRRRVELCGDDDEDLRFRLLVDAATRHEVGLGDRREAISSLSEALAVRPGDTSVMRRLDDLYSAERMWPELLENLQQQAQVADSDDARRTVKKRIGALYADKLEDPQQALEAYRDVLSGGFDEDAVAAIRQLGESRDELRAEAADALEPVLRTAGRHADLADILELRLRALSDAPERARTLRSIAEVVESSLGDRSRALEALLRALAEEPGDETLHAAIERIATELGSAGWQRYADTLAERAAAIFDASVTTELFARLGKVAEERLSDNARAAKAYMSAAERSGDTESILAALDRLYGRLGETHALGEVLERRIAFESDAHGQADLYYRLATLQKDSFGERAQALATLRQALDRVADHAPSREAIEALLDHDELFDDAFDALEGVYRTLLRHEDLASLYLRRVRRASSVSERTKARLELARVLERDVRDAARARSTVEGILSDDLTSEDALSELERLAQETSGWSSACDALAKSLAGAVDLDRAACAELWGRLARWRRDKASDAPGAEAAFIEALSREPDNLESLRAVEALRRAPGRERDLVDTLRTRAKLETELDVKRGLLREAKSLAESRVEDAALAEASLRDLLAEDEADLWALEELTTLRSRANDSSEVVTLLLKRAQLEVDGAKALERRHEAARVLTEKLKDTSRATSLYEEILDTEPSDPVAAASLRKLYAEAGRDKDLVRLLERLIDVATAAADRSALRLELARLQNEKFSSPEDAIDTLRALLDEESGHGQAVLALSQLFEKTGKDAELAELLKSQLGGAQERGDVATELTLLVRLGEVYETRLSDSAAALESYERVLERDGSHAAALEAIARLCEKRHVWDRAATALAKRLELATDGSGVAWALRLAAAREALGDAVGVEDALKKGLALEPANTDVRGKLRALYEKGKNWPELASLLVGDADLVVVPIGARPVARPSGPPSRGSVLPPPSAVAGPLPPLPPAHPRAL